MENTDFEEKNYLFRKACHFYSFLEDGELGMHEKLQSVTSLDQFRVNEIMDLEREDEAISDEEMESIAQVIGIPVPQLLWNQEQMDQLYQEFDLDDFADIRDINKRVLNAKINPLQFSHSVMLMIFSDGEADHREKKFFDFLKRSFSLSDEEVSDFDASQQHFRELIASLPEDKRFLSIVVKWIIGAVFADGEVSPEEVTKLNELLNEIKSIRGGLFGDDLQIESTT